MSGKQQQIEDLWERVPGEWQKGAHGVQRYLHEDHRVERISSFFRGSSEGVPAMEVLQRRIPSAKPRSMVVVEDEVMQRYKEIYGFSYIISGGVDCRFTNHGWKTAHPGDLLIINGPEEPVPEVRHRPGLREMSVHVDGVTGYNLVEAGVWELRAGIVSIGRQSNLVQRYVELQRDMENHGISTAKLLRSFLGIVEEIATISAATSPEEQFRSRARTELAARAGEPGATERVARVLGLSPRQFRRRFRAVTGATPQQYQLQVRMTRAAHLLSFCSVKETAARLGYSDPFVFSRQFKRSYGMSPRESQQRGEGSSESSVGSRQ